MFLLVSERLSNRFVSEKKLFSMHENNDLSFSKNQRWQNTIHNLEESYEYKPSI